MQPFAILRITRQNHQRKNRKGCTVKFPPWEFVDNLPPQIHLFANDLPKLIDENMLDRKPVIPTVGIAKNATCIPHLLLSIILCMQKNAGDGISITYKFPRWEFEVMGKGFTEMSHDQRADNRMRSKDNCRQAV